MMSPAELLPHAGPAVLLDDVLAVDAESATAAVTIRATDRFAHPGCGVPAHVAIEWMAQACGLFAGHEARTASRPVRLGMLLGTRHFQASRTWFGFGERLVVTAILMLRDGAMGVFDCTVRDGAGAECATARLTTYQPPESAG